MANSVISGVCVYPYILYVLIPITKEPQELCTLNTSIATVQWEKMNENIPVDEWMSKPRKVNTTVYNEKKKNTLIVGRKEEWILL